MKKLIAITALIILVGCSSNKEKMVKDFSGEETSFGTPIVNVTVKGNKIISLNIDEIQDGTSKKTMGSNYGMAVASSIGKEWYQQIASLEKYIVDNGLDSIKVDNEGKPTNEDLKSSVTIRVKPYIDTIQNAIKSAK